MLSSFVGGGGFSLSVSHVFDSKRSLSSLDSVTTESLSVVSTCTNISSITLVTVVSSAVTGVEAISLVESAASTSTGFCGSLTGGVWAWGHGVLGGWSEITVTSH